MRIIVTYEVSGKGLDLEHFKKGPLADSLDDLKDRLEAEGAKVRVKILEVRKW